MQHIPGEARTTAAKSKAETGASMLRSRRDSFENVLHLAKEGNAAQQAGLRNG